MKRIAALAPLALLAVLVALAAFVLMRGGERETVSAGQIGRPAPTFALARLGGGAPVTGGDLAGRAHLINLFASWCGPCRVEHPLLMALKDRGVSILGVAYKDEPANAAAFLRELGDPFTMAGLDPDGRFGLELGMAGVPETFVIGPDGTIRAVHRGPLTQAVVDGVILPALTEP